MKERILVGGYGSTSRQYQFLAEQHEAQTGVRTTGRSFHEAMANPSGLASLIAGKDVVGHSGAQLAIHRAVMLEGAFPERLTAIAPPVRERSLHLMQRGLAMRLGGAAEALAQIEHKVGNGESLRELMRAPWFYGSVIPQLAEFDAMQSLADIARSGTKVTVGLMSHDGLFNNSNIMPWQIRQLRHMGASVVVLSGTHTSFTRDFDGTLDQLERAEDFDLAATYSGTVSLADEVYRQIEGAATTLRQGLGQTAHRLVRSRLAA